jgi:hypothetical protein
MAAGIIVVLVGIVFLLQSLGIIAGISWDIIWPTLIILLGLMMIKRRSLHWHCCGKCDKECKAGIGEGNTPKA